MPILLILEEFVMVQKDKESAEINVSKSTLSIANEGTPVPETWEDFQKEEILFEESISTTGEPHAEPLGFSAAEFDPAAVAAGFDIALKVWELLKDTSGVSAEPKSTHVLPLKDPDGLNYVGETFRSPARKTEGSSLHSSHSA